MPPTLPGFFQQFFAPLKYGPLYLTPQVVAGNFVGGTGAKGEASSMSPLRLAGNQGSFVSSHDSSSTLYCHDQFGADRGTIVLTGATLTDAEGIAVTMETTPRVIVGAFGDNAASRTTKQLFIFDEPTLTGGTVTIPNDGSWQQVDFVYPSSPLWAGGANRGDAETMFVADGKIYIVSKREAIPKLFSLPLQASYSGTQTMTYEGEIYDIPDVTGVTIGNAVDGCISSDEFHVLIKTYGQVWRWSRETTDTTISTLLATVPEEMSYVGLGNHPTQEPQGEAISFNHDDSAVYFVSETGGGSSATNFPLFKSTLSTVPTILELTLQSGVSGYAASEDTYVQQGINEGTNFSTEISFIADKNVSDERFGLLRFDDVNTLLDSAATVVGAALDLYIANEGISFAVYEITNAAKAWTASTVTWTSLGGVTVGIDTPGNPCASVSGIDTRAGAIQLALDPAVVARWKANPAANLGLLFVGTDEADGLQFTSNEDATAGNRPRLVVQYNPDPNALVPITLEVQHGLAGYTGGEDTFWWQGGAGAGTDYSTAVSIISDKSASDERFAYHKWGGLDALIPVGSTVSEVEIDLYVNTEGQGMDMHELLSAFDPTLSYNDLITAGKSLALNDVDVASAASANWVGLDTYVGPITLPSTAELVALVQSWVDDDAANNGVLAVATHASDGQQVDSNESVTQTRRPLLRVTYTNPGSSDSFDSGFDSGFE
jgi:hypothetical protein